MSSCESSCHCLGTSGLTVLITALSWSLCSPCRHGGFHSGSKSQRGEREGRAAFQHHLHRSCWAGLSAAVAPSQKTGKNATPFPLSVCFLEFQCSLLCGFIRPSYVCLSCTISSQALTCFHVISYSAALSLKLVNNGFGAKPSSGKWNIALRMALSGYKVCVRKAVTECCVFIMRTVSQTAPAAVNPV